MYVDTYILAFSQSIVEQSSCHLEVKCQATVRLSSKATKFFINHQYVSWCVLSSQGCYSDYKHVS